MAPAGATLSAGINLGGGVWEVPAGALTGLTLTPPANFNGALTLGEVSQNLLVSNGNVTQLRTRLSEDGLIETELDENDRRIQRVRLTARGQSVFNKMAKAHAACVDRLLGDLAQSDKQALTRLLDSAKTSIRRKLELEATP